MAYDSGLASRKHMRLKKFTTPFLSEFLVFARRLSRPNQHHVEELIGAWKKLPRSEQSKYSNMKGMNAGLESYLEEQKQVRNARTPSNKTPEISEEINSIKQVLRTRSSRSKLGSNKCHFYSPVKKLMTNPYRESKSTISPIAKDIAIRLTKDTFIMSEQMKRKAINSTPIERGPRHQDYCKCELNPVHFDKGNQGLILKHQLFISCQNAASDLSQLHNSEILAILTVGKYNTPVHYPYIKGGYFTISIENDERLTNVVTNAQRFINKYLQHGNVLVHCSEGIADAPFLLAGYLMKQFSMNSVQAVSCLKRVRSIISLNKFQMAELRACES